MAQKARQARATRPSRAQANSKSSAEAGRQSKAGRSSDPSVDGQAGTANGRAGGRDAAGGMGLDASAAILGANPFLGIDITGIMAAAGTWLASLGRRPTRLVNRTAGGVVELGKIAVGRSEIAPDRSDRRFVDPAWAEHPGLHRVMQAYLLLSSTLQELVEDAELDPLTDRRARYALTLLTDAAAPTNSFVTNPAAIKRAFDTAGISLLRGARNLVKDLRTNGAMPSMVDKRPFGVGRNIAISTGAVVYRDEVIELIQYAPTTDTAHQRPLVLIPPQINKYYILDLAPGRSFIEYAVSQGIPAFAISWRNPTVEHRDWNLDTYVQACLDAIQAATEITHSSDCNLFGACAGGITMALLTGHLAARGSDLVNSATFAVTIMDTQAPSMLGMFSSPDMIAAAIRRSRRKGYLDGGEMSRIFAWLRPNDLVWNYWVNNYLMGNDPPAFDILFWNADATRLPAGLHAGFLQLFRGDPLREPGALKVLGTPIDLKKVTIPTYVVAGVTDHIVPWTAAYGATQVLGGPSQFVLSSSGHIQSLINPPGNPKASYHTDGPDAEDPQGWLAGATQFRGSWWEHWAQWIGARSGERASAAQQLGSERYPPLDPAPGRYVHQT